MTRAPVHEQAPSGAKEDTMDGPRDPHPLAGLASCMNLPEREGIGPPLEAELPDGHLLDGRFVIREAIGRSGMATVYRAEDRQRGMTVAVKVPLAKVEAEPAAFGRYEREERICAAMSDPLLLRYVPVDPNSRSRAYFVTEYLDGCSLAFVMHRTRPMPEREALRIAAVACEALSQMHRKGFIHLDVKPANFMVGRDQSLCLLDFGLASEIETSSGFLSSLTTFFGTPDYMAPEHVRNRHCDERSDIYSLGVILYQMLTGELPFKAQDAWKAAQLRVTGDPVAPRAVNPLISYEAEEIVLRAMRRDPSERYGSASAFRADLLAPKDVKVTGLCTRLRPPHFEISLTGTPVISGILISLGVLGSLVGAFLFLSRHR
jgi:serine/threonine-protein kinase